ncbi:MAG TPA: flagellar basal-body rod protein FlgG [Ignavibacteriales bacterium]|nr:flagellar basal-body rod protein FlgG [Ignavibacteriales bacterium]
MSTRALRTAATGMFAQQVNIETISNNIANINTTGFKKNKAEFKDMMYQEVSINPQFTGTQAMNEKTSVQIQVGNGVQPASTQKLFSQGDLTPTGNPLDVAIQGDGFLQVRKPDGTFAYTRDGSLKVSSNGTLVTANGYTLEPGITLNEDISSVTIAKDGTVEARDISGNTVTLGNLELIKFMNPGGLLPVGDNLYVETPASGTPLTGTPGQEGFGELNQGYLEASNVDIVEEMISMITAQRAYEINSKTVKTVEDMMTMANNLKR